MNLAYPCKFKGDFVVIHSHFFMWGVYIEHDKSPHYAVAVHLYMCVYINDRVNGNNLGIVWPSRPIHIIMDGDNFVRDWCRTNEEM